jgi:hypothetical protein
MATHSDRTITTAPEAQKKPADYTAKHPVADSAVSQIGPALFMLGPKNNGRCSAAIQF